MSIPVKINQNCSNIFLIDENLCLGNSYNIINYNVASLSSSLVYLENYQTRWKNLFTTFQNYSSVWIKTVTNIQSFSGNWASFSKTVLTMNSNWNKPYTIFYPQILEINSWNNISSIQQKNYIAEWLQNNFPAALYNINQIVNVTMYLYEKATVSFNFERNFEETCTPNCAGISVGCKAGSCPGLYQGCNHHGGLAGVKGCDNVYDYCTQRATFSAPQNVSCTGRGGRTLRLALTRTATDTHVIKTINIPFININKTWVPN